MAVSWGRVVVIMPTYNEIDSLERVVSHLLRTVPGVHVLIVDDGSPDGTGDLAETMAARDPRVHVLHRTAKNGLGRAYLAGFGWAAQHEFLYAVEMDADGSHPAESLSTMLEMLEAGQPRLGTVIGSRWVPGGRVLDWPASRQLLSRAGNFYARTALRLRLRDVTAGYRAYPVSVLEDMGLTDTDSKGYCFQIEMTLRTLDAGYAIEETPIVFRERESGVSKMSGGIVVEAMVRTTLWGLQRLVGRRTTRRVSA